MKKIIPIVILVLVIGSIAFTLFNNKQEMAVKAEEAMKTTEFIPVRTEVVGKSYVNVNFTSNGTFEANRELNLQSEASGKVVKILKRKGDEVKEGQLIAQLDDELLQSELVIATLTFEQSQKDLERYKNLSGTDAITKKQLEEIQNSSKTAEAQLNMIKKRISNTRITAPIPGYINDDHIEIGTLVSPGMPLLDIVNTQPLKLSIQVSESEIAQISVGDTVLVKAGVFPDKEYKGKVTYTSSKGDASLRYKVEISLKDEAADLKPGMFGYATFNYDKQEAIMINRKSLISGLKNPEVYVVEEGKARVKAIKVASIGQDQLVLLEGLQEGEKVITTGLINLKDGVAVTEL
ncbi:efflux RND transporter periplasmic adaptor subunit [Cyclobacterium sp.]|uniref:efflux RND transporter periplasmic adaptor subunit n=1 Tax=Cyclobacterium sp. TaxID=1966343 RepID=UPI001985645F|nr:efflux RND transporter periplasmic adaptor subunit [Cyclobacterium sp.]MBD3631286.1 efflux RND transporter periplasmic adaptor subunit [Cyclobacterium sp.]